MDLGCGKCVFLAEAARQNREVNWIGIDISCDILGVGRRNIAAAYGDEEPDNIALCSYNIERLQDVFFGRGRNQENLRKFLQSLALCTGT